MEAGLHRRAGIQIQIAIVPIFKAVAVYGTEANTGRFNMDLKFLKDGRRIRA